MLIKGWVSAEWKMSANNRRARFYTLTTAGRKQPMDGDGIAQHIQMLSADVLTIEEGSLVSTVWRVGPWR